MSAAAAVIVAQPLQPGSRPVNTQQRRTIEMSFARQAYDRITAEIINNFKAHLDSTSGYGIRRKNYVKLAIECLDPAASDDARLVLVSQRELNRLTNAARTATHVSSQAVGVQTLDVEIAEGFKRGRKKGDLKLGHFGDAAIDAVLEGPLELPTNGHVRRRQTRLHDQWDQQARQQGDVGTLQALHTTFSQNHDNSCDGCIKTISDAGGRGVFA